MSPAGPRLPVTVTTPLGADAFRFRELWGEERLSGLFRYDVELDSADSDVAFADLVGEEMTVTYELPGGEERHYHGVIARVSQGVTNPGATRYRIEMRPKLWLLTLKADCKVFQAKSVPDIVKDVLNTIGYTDVKLSLTGTHAAREYCVQYRETAFDFISRLMEEEGIFYFFEHASDKHTLVLGDDADANPDCPEVHDMRYRISGSDALLVDEVADCTIEQRVTPQAYSLDDYHFETPATDLFVKEGSDPLQLHDYPGGYTKTADGTSRARVWLEAAQADSEMMHGRGACPSFTAGHKFKLKGHPRADVNGDWVLRAVTHALAQEQCDVTFSAAPKRVPFRPARVTPRPVIAGSQTAVVTGQSGEEAWTDKYGRVHVQFHWDQLGAKDEKSSCWVRVSQAWAGQGWGAFFLPRVGQEVVVSFLDGDPDRPLVTGAVYNAEQTVPYALPANQSRSGVKSNSLKGGEGFNELRFEDKKGEEELYVHAQKDMKVDVLNDQTTTVTKNRTVKVSEGDELFEVLKGKRTVTVTEGEEIHTVGGKRTLAVTGAEKHTNEANFDQVVEGNFTIKVKGNITLEAEGSVKIKSGAGLDLDCGASLLAKAAQSLTNKAGTALTNEAGTALTNKAGTSLTNEAQVTLTSKAGASQKVEASGMVEVKGAMVKLN